MPLTNCEINLVLTWSESCVNISLAGTKTAITDIKREDSVVLLSINDSKTLL